MATTYRCAVCDGVFRFGDTDAAESEATRTCAGVPAEDCAIVCDACFQALVEERGEAGPGPALH